MTLLMMAGSLPLTRRFFGDCRRPCLRQINGTDVQDARHDQVVALLTGLERFVRLSVQRQRMVTASEAAARPVYRGRGYSPGRPALNTAYSAGSYMANRPSYTGHKTPERSGSAAALASLATSPASPSSPAARPSSLQRASTEPPPSAAAAASVPPSQSRAAPPAQPQAVAPLEPYQTPQLPVTPQQFPALIPAHFTDPSAAPAGGGGDQEGTAPSLVVDRHQAHAPVSTLPEFPTDAPKEVGVWTESVTKSTFTETTVTRRTENKLVRPPPPTKVRPLARCCLPLQL